MVLQRRFLDTINRSEDENGQTERLRSWVSQSPISTPEAALHVTLSLGVACAGPGQNQVDLLLAADEALYRAKRNGRDRIEVAAFSKSAGD